MVVEICADAEGCVAGGSCDGAWALDLFVRERFARGSSISERGGDGCAPASASCNLCCLVLIGMMSGQNGGGASPPARCYEVRDEVDGGV